MKPFSVEDICSRLFCLFVWRTRTFGNLFIAGPGIRVSTFLHLQSDALMGLFYPLMLLYVFKCCCNIAWKGCMNLSHASQSMRLRPQRTAPPCLLTCSSPCQYHSMMTYLSFILMLQCFSCLAWYAGLGLTLQSHLWEIWNSVLHVTHIRVT